MSLVLRNTKLDIIRKYLLNGPLFFYMGEARNHIEITLLGVGPQSKRHRLRLYYLIFKPFLASAYSPISPDRIQFIPMRKYT